MKNISLHSSTKICKNNKIIFKKVENIVYILDPINSTIHTFNFTASFIWNILEKPKKISEIVNLVCNEFEGEPNMVKNDVELFISNYLELGFLHQSNM